MATRTPYLGRRLRVLSLVLGVMAAATACADPSAPADPKDVDRDTATVLPATRLSQDDLTPSGNVVQTPDGYTVDGSLSLQVDDSTSFTFLDADLRVRTNPDGRVTSISGTAEIPSPHERIEFEDPVRGQVGFFTGEYLNREGDIDILLDDTTDYFVFDIGIALQMNIATGETGADAVKPISVSVPVGGRILLVIDYADPMYYVYGEQDLLGAIGVGWSLNGRIPFEPARQIADLGDFEGRNTRTGTFSIKKIFNVTGQTVDNRTNEAHLTLEEPYESEVGYSYQQGWNGTVEIGLSFNDVFGLAIPLADASGGYLWGLNTESIFEGHAYASGSTSDHSSWWPDFLPIRPANALEVEAFATDQLDYSVEMAGTYGLALPDGVYGLSGEFLIADEKNTWSGQHRTGERVWGIGGEATLELTTMYLEPPQEFTDSLSQNVNDRILPRIEEAQRAWNDLQEATGAYEFELSLRGLRTQLPGIVDVAKAALASGIASELSQHTGTVYYSSLRDHLYAADDPYYAALDNLKAQALQTTDNDQTRAAIEAALRSVAARRIFRTTYRYYVGPVLVKTVEVSRRIMSDADANTLIEAADNAYRIQETSDVKITMQQIYDQVPDKELFEQVRDDIQNGVILVRDIEELGLTYLHDDVPGEFLLYADIDGRRYGGGPVSALTVAALLLQLPDIMIEALKVN